MLRSRRAQALVVLALFAPLFLFWDRALAIQDSEDKVWFGPVGITPGERALVNIYAIGNPNEIGNPDETPWNFVVRVVDRLTGRTSLLLGGPDTLPAAQVVTPGSN